MISPELFNMLLYRSFWGRKESWQVPEHLYNTVRGAFGRMPIVIMLGDFLQLRPTASNSLLDDLRSVQAMRPDVFIPAEYQHAKKLFLNIARCYALRISNRFEDEKLKALMNFMRAPSQQLPSTIRKTWESIQAQPHDPRLAEPRFQTGHMLGVYWGTVTRWAAMRAARDAKTLHTPTYVVQAAYAASPPVSRADYAKLLNHYSPYDTGAMHGIFLYHVGMRVRLLETLDKERGLVKNAEGVVVRILHNPADDELVQEAWRNRSQSPRIYLAHLPLGFLLKMDNYTSAPFSHVLADQSPQLTPAATCGLVFFGACDYASSFHLARPHSEANRLLHFPCRSQNIYCLSGEDNGRWYLGGCSIQAFEG